MKLKAVVGEDVVEVAGNLRDRLTWLGVYSVWN